MLEIVSGDTAFGVFRGVLPFPQFIPIPSSYHSPQIILTPSVPRQAAGTNKKWLKCVFLLYPLGFINK